MTWLIFNLFSTQVVASEAYKEMTGRDIDESRINYWYKRIVDLYDGNKLAGLSEFVTQAHMLNFEQFHTTGRNTAIEDRIIRLGSDLCALL